MTTLQIIWFWIIAGMLIGYTVLDGFDLGVGFWHLFTRKGEERRTMLTAIGPFWDGNEVWLISAGALIFAAFPPVYATVFSGFYLALILVLVMLIIRAVSIEFGAKETTDKARAYWDPPFALSSIVAILLFGVAFGNILHGIPLNDRGDFAGNFFTLLNPFALLIGILNLAMLAMHGALFVAMRTEGDLQQHARKWTRRSWLLYLPLALITFIVAANQPHLLRNYLAYPIIWVLPTAVVVTIILSRVWSIRGRDKAAFTASAFSIALILATGAAALFPILVPAQGNPTLSLTAANSSSSPLSQSVMLVLTGIGMPLVLIYTIWVYRTFGGKVKKGEHY
ncbi:MAG: cytochrome d ubiquinol oxidase subunit II [Armatimonadota bacterium]